MTLRRCVLEGRFADELDRQIQWALRERVSGTTLSPQVWERIREQVDGAAPRQPRLNFTLFLRALVAWLSVETCLPSLVVHPTQRGEVVVWGYDLDWVRALGQHHMVMRQIS